MLYKRILLKLSGEALLGERSHGVDPKRILAYSKEIRQGKVGEGEERGTSERWGKVGQGEARQSKTGQGRARPSKAEQGEARRVLKRTIAIYGG